MPTSLKAPIFWSTLSSIAAQLLSFLAFVVLARTLGPETFGLVALAASIIDLLLVVAAAGLLEALVQRKHLDEGDADTAFWASLGLGLAFCLLTIAAANPIAAYYDRPDLAPIIFALAFIFILTPLGVIPAAELTRAMNFRAIAVRNITASILSAAVGIGMAFAQFGAWALVGQRLVYAGMLTLLAWTAVGWAPKLTFKPQVLKALLQVGGYLSVSQILTTLNGRLAELISGAYVGPHTVAFIRAGARVADVLNQVTITPFQQIAMPAQARVQHDPAARNGIFFSISRSSAFFMFPIFLGLFSVAPPMVELVFGPGWEQAGWAIRMLVLAVIPLQVNVLFISAMTAAGRSRLVLIWSVIQAVIGIGLVIAASSHGWLAMLAINVVRAYLLMPVALFTLARVLDISWRTTLGSIRPAALSAFVMAASVTAGQSVLQHALPAVLQLAVLIPTGVIIYGLLYFIQDRHGLRTAIDLLRRGAK